jgi:hypothetical protein
MQSLCIRKIISSKKADLADSAQQFQAPRYLAPAKIAAFSGIITPLYAPGIRQEEKL